MAIFSLKIGIVKGTTEVMVGRSKLVWPGVGQTCKEATNINILLTPFFL